jgi:Arm DNA-binding domain
MPRAKYKRVLTELAVRKTKAEGRAKNLWDAACPGLVLRIQVSGSRSYKYVYSRAGDSEWFTIGWVPLSHARRIATKLRLAVAEGRDPVAERKAERTSESWRLRASPDPTSRR